MGIVKGHLFLLTIPKRVFPRGETRNYIVVISPRELMMIPLLVSL